MSRARAILGLFVFAGGVATGIIAAQLVNPPPPTSPWASLARVSEPAGSADVASMIAHGDAEGLARTLDPQLLQKLQQGIQPLVDITGADFTGAAGAQGDILAAYVITGKDQSGNKQIVGVVLRIHDGKVVGVN